MTTDHIAIWAEAPKGHGEFVIGDSTKPSGLPWPHQPSDLEHFRETTRDRVLVMGRTTFDRLPAILKSPESTKERPLVVLTSRFTGRHQGVESRAHIQGIPWVEDETTAGDLLFEAPRWFDRPKGVAVIGGAKVIELFAPLVNRLVISRIMGGPFPLADVAAPRASAFDLFTQSDGARLADGTIVNTFTKRSTK